jgi:hypothetical protein
MSNDAAPEIDLEDHDFDAISVSMLDQSEYRTFTQCGKCAEFEWSALKLSDEELRQLN